MTGSALGSLGGVAAGTVARGIGSKLSGWLDDALSWLTNLFRGGATVPAFGSGAVVYGPTLAMVGEYPGASSNPEVIAPLSDLESMMDNSEQTAVLRQILRAIERGQTVTVTIRR